MSRYFIYFIMLIVVTIYFNCASFSSKIFRDIDKQIKDVYVRIHHFELSDQYTMSDLKNKYQAYSDLDKRSVIYENKELIFISYFDSLYSIKDCDNLLKISNKVLEDDEISNKIIKRMKKLRNCKPKSNDSLLIEKAIQKWEEISQLNTQELP